MTTDAARLARLAGLEPAGPDEMGRELAEGPAAVEATLDHVERLLPQLAAARAAARRTVLLGTGASLAMARTVEPILRVASAADAGGPVVVREPSQAVLGAPDGDAFAATDLVVAISQSGGSPETLAAAREARAAGACLVAVTAGAASALASAADIVIHTPSGPEEGAATKSELAALAALLGARRRAALRPRLPGRPPRGSRGHRRRPGRRDPGGHGAGPGEPCLGRRLRDRPRPQPGDGDAPPREGPPCRDRLDTERVPPRPDRGRDARRRRPADRDGRARRPADRLPATAGGRAGPGRDAAPRRRRHARPGGHDRAARGRRGRDGDGGPGRPPRDAPAPPAGGPRRGPRPRRRTGTASGSSARWFGRPRGWRSGSPGRLRDRDRESRSRASTRLPAPARRLHRAGGRPWPRPRSHRSPRARSTPGSTTRPSPRPSPPPSRAPPTSAGASASTSATRRSGRRDPAVQEKIANRLGWLDLPVDFSDQIPALEAFGETTRDAGFTAAIVAGMGGSSLAPEVIATAFGDIEDWLAIRVLDSTDPDAVRGRLGRPGPARDPLHRRRRSPGPRPRPSPSRPTPGSGSTTRCGRTACGCESPGEFMVAVTDPGQVARRDPPPGRDAGRLPQPRVGRGPLLRPQLRRPPARVARRRRPRPVPGLRGRRCTRAAWRTDPTANPGVALGATLGALAAAGRDKLTFVVDPAIGPLGAWLEQLVAESTGKLGTGIVPVDREPLGAPRRTARTASSCGSPSTGRSPAPPAPDGSLRRRAPRRPRRRRPPGPALRPHRPDRPRRRVPALGGRDRDRRDRPQRQPVRRAERHRVEGEHEARPRGARAPRALPARGAARDRRRASPSTATRALRLTAGDGTLVGELRRHLERVRPGGYLADRRLRRPDGRPRRRDRPAPGPPARRHAAGRRPAASGRASSTPPASSTRAARRSAGSSS